MSEGDDTGNVRELRPGISGPTASPPPPADPPPDAPQPRGSEVAKASRGGPITRAERRRKILNLRVAGFTEEQIAEQLEMTPNSVGRVINAWLEKQERASTATVERVRTLQLERLDAAVAQVMVAVKKGNLKAVDRLVRLEQLRARIAGTEAPSKVDHSGTIDHRVTPGEVEQMERAWAGSGGDVVDADHVELPARAGD